MMSCKGSYADIIIPNILFDWSRAAAYSYIPIIGPNIEVEPSGRVRYSQRLFGVSYLSDRNRGDSIGRSLSVLTEIKVYGLRTIEGCRKKHSILPNISN